MLVSGLMLACSEQKISTLDEHLAVTFDAQPIDSEDGTRSAYVNGDFQWTANDTVGIYPATGSQIYFSMAAGAGTSRATFDRGGWGFKSNSVYYSYYPFMADFYLNRHKIPVSFEGQVQDGRNNSEHFGLFDYMYTPGAQVNNNSLVFSYKHLVCIIEVMATLPAGTYKQIIHRDLKPENILITNNGQNVKIIDFGLSDADDYYIHKDPAGTRVYSSPEQLNGQILDARSDIYSLGVIISEVAGKWYSHIAARCLRRSPAKRFQTASQVRRAVLQSPKRWFFPVILAIVIAALATFVLAHKYNSDRIFDAATESIIDAGF